MTSAAAAFGFDADPSLQARLWEAPRATVLHEMIAVPAAMAPDVVAFGLTNHGGPVERITWGALASAARRRARQLRDAGVRPGDRVVLMLPTCSAFFDTFFGVLLAGGVPVPVAPPASTRRERLGAHLETTRRIVGDCGAAVLVALARTLDLLGDDLRRAQPGLRTLSTEAAGEPLLLTEPRLAETGDTALLQYTSGSTSDPKGVELTHANLIANLSAIAAMTTRSHSSGVFWLPFHHDMGLIGTVLMALYTRRPAVYMPPQAFIKTPAVWLRTISDIRATATVAPNFAFSYCVDTLSAEDLEGVSLDCLEVAMNGAEPIDPHAVRAFQEKFQSLGLRDGVVRPVYGLAESSLAVTFADPGRAVLDEVDADRLEREGLAERASPGARSRLFISVGRPLATQEVRIVDEGDRTLSDRHVGEVVVRGPSIMKGYFRREQESADTIRNGWLHTGDLGYHAHGQLFITGRSKDLIIRHGKNYYAHDIERCIAVTPDLVPGGTVAFGVEEAGGARVVIVAETLARDPENQAAIVRGIREACQGAFLFGPDVVKLVAPGVIPRTTSGKLRRQACKRWYLDQMAATAFARDGAETSA